MSPRHGCPPDPALRSPGHPGTAEAGGSSKARKAARSGMSASSMPILLSGSSSWSPAADRSNTAVPRSVLSCTCWGTGRPSLACWAAMPRRIAVRSAGG
eukprot:12916251-Alexandrium_andersonii.AAC.1